MWREKHNEKRKDCCCVEHRAFPFNPVIPKSLDPGITLTRSGCAWGHNLVVAERLAEKRSDLNLDAEMNIRKCRTLRVPMTLRAGFALFDPFFSELRYPQELKKLGGVGEDEKLVLDVLAQECYRTSLVTLLGGCRACFRRERPGRRNAGRPAAILDQGPSPCPTSFGAPDRHRWTRVIARALHRAGPGWPQ
jgi:hypothetical protein